jgi:hypothetical protein
MSIAAKLVLLLVCMAIGAYGGYQWRDGIAARAEAARLELERKGAEQTRAAERRQSVDVIGAINDAKKREQLARAAAAGARSERDGLRDDLAAAQRDLPSAAPAACIERAAALGGLLDQCAAAYQELAGKADRHVSDALMLEQAWPKASKP